ncbi:uncharacterized protein SPPG_01069 [Spizellomyces punctatus DAOM BR117]|uniref:SAM-dependent MTase RsmB/NOP-type domain-containing protein n=1 Tax=Spizellomyces punctatus (strain DAOM BR117) TaxID=645134 RepID=A0A0L0HRC1_SPIPD|nr:uncharacterized protein SPPG_01069 [Spizellomyces punctatus DAOM BR117]KND03593.1 hypothetical protein SPPG_01069 [Spizellomyces punctatus DAOM BR117]|eukprot:XP_016611632.1 hypothetical protein SPPG_01069 [Spizellomyces punctatus DAOM BR117]
MDVRPNHAVLDMCAAPGSKTAQILEALHANESEAIPDGLLIANDADQARSHMLVKQAKRLQSPCLMVTNHEAQQFPNIFFAPKGSLDASVLQFDRILADVPCSGDGTLRKNMPIWQTWTQGNGNALHRVQLPILLRGCSLLKVGGRIVYSTCSFNPLENEAVVAGALKVAGGALRLVDVSSELPQLVRRQGLSTWKVQSKSGEFYSKFADVPEAESVGLLPSMFPPENAAELNLDRCLRVYPFLQNTGGFFVAVLEKVASYGALDRIPGNEPNVELEATAEEKEETETKEATTVELDTSSINERKRSQDDDSNRSAKRTRTETEGSSEIVKYKSAAAWEGRESPFVFLNSDNQELMGMREFYGLDDSFPQEQFVVRSEKDNYRTVYFVSRAIKNVITASNSFRLNIVNTGIRIFTRSAGNDTGAECPFRLSNEGLATIGRYVSGKRVVQVPMSDIVTLLSIEYPKFTEFGEELQKKLTEMSMGSCIIKFDPTLEKNYTGSARSTILLPIWRAHVSVSLLLNKQERKSLMHRLTGEDLSIQGGLDNNAGGGSTEGESQKAAIAGETEPTTESVA